MNPQLTAMVELERADELRRRAEEARRGSPAEPKRRRRREPVGRTWLPAVLGACMRVGVR